MSTLTGLARRLVEVGLLSPEVAEAAFDQSLKAGQSFVTYLLENKLVSNCRYLALAVAEEFSVPMVDIDSIADLRKSGLKKVMDGYTSLEEINRVVYKEKEKDE
jgi:hypothetical protein